MRVDPAQNFGTRECPGCGTEIAANNNRCPICGYEFPAVPHPTGPAGIIVGLLLALCVAAILYALIIR